MSKTILYIEDNPNDQRFVKKVLGRQGYNLLVAGDGEVGLTLAAEHKPDLILIDLQMPGLDGLETARQMRALEGCKETVIVALTAYAEKYKRDVYLDAGFTEYQQKQAGIKPLLALVTRHLGDKDSAQTDQDTSPTGKDTSPTGKDTSPTGKDASPTGKDASPTG